ncbi:putative carboxylesterase 17 [Curcuma longa]|uniref:putative carboxylesterase 17 n=1 Tax=Curcuma longa TaxID=136217 RepID=UPI003D9E45A9
MMGAVSQQLTQLSISGGGKDDAVHGAVVEEIHGLIRLYQDGHVERLPAVADVPCTWTPQPGVVSQDVSLAPSAALWARLHLPRAHPLQISSRLPLLVYFHGGGFCVGSPAWRCYHEFLARLAAHAACAVLSVSYRLAPEHRLPAAFQDGLSALRWVRQQAVASLREDSAGSWRARCDFGRVFLGGDSAGAAIAYRVAAAGPACCLTGVILIQPFFGGVERTWSEKNQQAPKASALNPPTSDCYWRMALPAGADRDHPWCNPLSKKAPPVDDQRLPPLLVCISDLDILRDRNLDLCKALRYSGESVEEKMYADVGHAFQVLHNYPMSQNRTIDMLTDIKAFISCARPWGYSRPR